VQPMLVSSKSSEFCTGSQVWACSGHGVRAMRLSSGLGATSRISFAHLLCLTLFVFCPSTVRLFGQNPDTTRCFTPVDWVVAVDTSQSMDGKGQGAKKIFPVVKDVLHKFIPTIRDDDRLTLFAFNTTANRLISVTGSIVGRRLRKSTGCCHWAFPRT